MGRFNADGTPSDVSIKRDGAIPYASQITNNSNVSGDNLDDALNTLSTMGSLSYRGTWNATTNTPTLASGTGTKGYYYVVSVSGSTTIDTISDWVIGDWIIFNGTVWEKADHTDVVASVFTRTGAVVAAASDYDASQVDNDATYVGGTFVSDALDILGKTKRIVVSGLEVETLNDDESTALGGSAAEEWCPTTAIVHMEDVGAGTAANGDVQISIGTAAGGTQILAATACTNLIALNTKFIIDLSATVKPAIAGDSTIHVRVTTADTTAGAGHLADVYLVGQVFTSGT